jgi:hypothetical protein
VIAAFQKTALTSLALCCSAISAGGMWGDEHSFSRNLLLKVASTDVMRNLALCIPVVETLPKEVSGAGMERWLVDKRQQK